MNFKELVKTRYSVRKYKDRVVEKEIIEGVLDIMRNAPSAVNYQPWQFIVLTSPEIRGKIAETYPVSWIKDAPVIIVACGDHSKSWVREDGKDHCDIDVAIAVDHLSLAAAEVGLGTCWVCAFDKVKCSEILELPDHLEPVVIIPMGYPLDEAIRNKKRKSLDEVVSWR